MAVKFDFSGWATRNDIRCSDGRTIRKNAFLDSCNGNPVPLVWQHQHNGPENVLGHALLENREEGVYAYCSFNNSDLAKSAKEAVKHGDITHMSIYANHLKQNGGDVLHGTIREVSLVIAGANPGATIESLEIVHGDSIETLDDEAIIYTDNAISHSDCWIAEESDLDESEEESMTDISHSEEDDEDYEVQAVWDSFTDKQKKAVYALITIGKEEGPHMEHSDADELEYALSEYYDIGEFDDDGEFEIQHAEDTGESVADIWDTLDDVQQDVAAMLIIDTLQHSEESYSDESMEHSDYEGEDMSRRNLFEQTGENTATLSHSEIVAIVQEAKDHDAKLSDVVLSHGINDITMLWPEAKNVTNTPQFIKRDDTWVGVVMNGVHKSPFSRIKSMFADITEDDARAKGYFGSSEKHLDENGKPYRDRYGNMVDKDGNKVYKKEEVFTLLKRITGPTTIYKKQSLDRDDILDIIDFDVVQWIRVEMRGMLEEEMARAILVGDGRSTASDDKINELCVRPIWKDEDFYTVKKKLVISSTDSEDDIARALIKTAVKSRKDYKGSGNPIYFTTEDDLTIMLLLEDKNGRRIYDTEASLCAAMRVSKIVTSPIMEGLTRQDTDGVTRTLRGIIVNLNDYWVGADKGGQVTTFDDFDIDFNKQKYLMETRFSGALVKWHGAIAIESVDAAQAQG